MQNYKWYVVVVVVVVVWMCVCINSFIEFSVKIFEREKQIYDYIHQLFRYIFISIYELQFSILFEILIIAVSDYILCTHPPSVVRICRPKQITLRAVEFKPQKLLHPINIGACSLE